MANMLQVKIKFRLKFLNQVYFQFSLSPAVIIHALGLRDKGD